MLLEEAMRLAYASRALRIWREVQVQIYFFLEWSFD